MSVFFRNPILNIQKSYFFITLLLFYSLYLFISFFFNKNFDEEFVYFFIVILIILFFLTLFQDIINTVIDTRSSFIYSQHLDLYNKNLDVSLLLISIEKDNLQFFIVFLELFSKIFIKLNYFFRFYLNLFFVKYLFVLFLKKLFQKMNFLIRKYQIQFDNSHNFSKNLTYKENFFFYIKDVVKFFLHNNKF